MKNWKKNGIVVLILLMALLVVSACGTGKKDTTGAEKKEQSVQDDQEKLDDKEAQDDQEKQGDKEAQDDQEKQNDKNDQKGQENVLQEDDVQFTREQAETYEVAVLKGPTAIGFIKAWEDSDNGETINTYHVTAYGTADEITAGIAKGDIDIAAVPCNLAAVLFSKTDGDISVSAINTLGVLYMVSASDEIHSVQDLKGKTIYTTGQGTTPEYTLNYILEKNGLKVGEDVKVEYKSEAAEAAAFMSQSEDGIAMLPQPYVSTVLMQNDKMKICLDMTEEWNKVSEEPLVTGVVIARNEVVGRNTKAYEVFLKDYQDSVKYVTEHTDDAAALVEKHDIFKAAVAKNAIPKCNITLITGEEMKKVIAAYLQVLYEANPQSVGGVMPEDSFYYSGS